MIEIPFDIFDSGSFKVIVSPMPGIQSVALGIFLPVGARHEHQKEKGIAHFLEHMLFKGTFKYSYKTLKQEIEGRGGILNGYTSQENTAYYCQILKKNFSRSLDILFDMVFNPKLPGDEVSKELNVILEEIKMQNDLPHNLVSSILDTLLWGNHSLGQEIMGTVDTLSQISREQLCRFHQDSYKNGQAIIVCVGDIKVRDFARALEGKKRFMEREERKKMEPPHPLKAFRHTIMQRPFDQTHFCLGFRSPSYHSRERYTVELIHVLLGANMSSRLFEELREKRGICYDISTEVRRYCDCGSFAIHVGLDAVNVYAACNRIMKQLFTMRNKLVSLRELDRAKDYLIGQMVMGLEKPQGRMFYLADSFLAYQKIDSFELVQTNIKQIQPPRVQAVAQLIFDFNRFCMSCVTNSPQISEEGFRRCIKEFV